MQVDWYRLFGAGRLVKVYISISHNDSVTLVPSFYFYFMVAGRGKEVVVAEEHRGL